MANTKAQRWEGYWCVPEQKVLGVGGGGGCKEERLRHRRQTADSAKARNQGFILDERKLFNLI